MIGFGSVPMLVANTGVPVGSVISFAGYVGNPMSSPPSTNDYNVTPPPAGFGYANMELYGWMVCDGRQLYCCDYPELFLILGFLYNQSSDTYKPGAPIPKDDPKAIFRLPDYRGYFLRMVSGAGQWPGGSNPDPDTSKRYMTYGESTKSAGVGSIEQDALETHQHAYYLSNANFLVSESGTPGATLTTPPPPNNQLTTEPTDNISSPPGKIRISEETRPKNMYVYYLIKYA
jgi:microcystin-dependent protein